MPAIPMSLLYIARLVITLLLVNTVDQVVPISFRDYDLISSAHEEIYHYETVRKDSTET